MDISKEGTIRLLPFDYSWKWLVASLHIAKNNYPTALKVGLIYILLAILGKIPVLGGILHSFLNVYLGAGSLLIARGWLRGENSQFETLFVPFQNKNMFRLLIPLSIFSSALNFVGTISQWAMEAFPALGLFAVLPLAFTALLIPLTFMIMAYSTPLIIFQEINTWEALQLSFVAILRNLVPELAGFLLLAVALSLCILMLVLPVFFVFIPLIIPLGYIKYATVFENLDIDECIKTNQSKPNRVDPV